MNLERLLGAAIRLAGDASWDRSRVVQSAPAPVATVTIPNILFRKSVESRTEDAQGALRLMLTAIQLREPALANHARRVAEVAVLLGRDLLHDQAPFGTLRVAALLHDLGKIAIPNSIVRKAGPLSHQQRLLIRQHAELGFGIARHEPALAAVAEAFVRTMSGGMGRATRMASGGTTSLSRLASSRSPMPLT